MTGTGKHGETSEKVLPAFSRQNQLAAVQMVPADKMSAARCFA
jgi:hypothetical protein